MDGEEKKEKEEGSLTALGATGLLTQDIDMSITTLVESLNGFNELIQLKNLLIVCHIWVAGAIFLFNYYKHYVQITL